MYHVPFRNRSLLPKSKLSKHPCPLAETDIETGGIYFINTKFDSRKKFCKIIC